MKNVLICCGTSMITSSVVVNKLKAALQKEHIEVKFHQCKYSDVPSMVKSIHPDLVIPTGQLSASAAGDVPVVPGISFLTGVGMDAAIKKVVEILKN